MTLKLSSLFFFFLYFNQIQSILNYFNIGGLFNLYSDSGNLDLNGIQIKESILMAINEINNKNDGLYDNILPNTTLKLVIDHPGVIFSTATMAANSLRRSFNKKGIRACIGPGSDAGIGGTVTIFREKAAFEIAYGGDDDSFGTTETFPNFLRLNPAAGIQARLLAFLVYKHFQWDRVAIIHSYNVYGYHVHLKFLQSVQEMGKTNNLVFTDYGTRNYKNLISQIKKSGAKIFVLLFSPVNLVIPILKEGWRQGLFREDSQIFGVQDLTTPLTWQYLSNKYLNKYNISLNLYSSEPGQYPTTPYNDPVGFHEEHYHRTLSTNNNNNNNLKKNDIDYYKYDKIKNLYNLQNFQNNVNIQDLETDEDDYEEYDMSLTEIASLMKGFIGVREMIDKSYPLTQSFLERWRNQKNTNQDEHGNCLNTTDDDGRYLHQYLNLRTGKYICSGTNFSEAKLDGSDIYPATLYAYDAVLLLARGLHQFLSTTTKTINDQNDVTYLDLQLAIDQIQSIGVTGLYHQQTPFIYRSTGERYTDVSYALFTFDDKLFLEETRKQAPQSNTKKSEKDNDDSNDSNLLPSSKGLLYSGRLHTTYIYTSCEDSEIIKDECYLQSYDTSIYNCSCHAFIFDTKNNLPPSDLPPLTTIGLTTFQQYFLILLSIILLILLGITSFLLYHYKKCRLVKITQPELSLITFIGGVCISIAGIFTAFELQKGSCRVIDCFCHIGFILIFAPLITKTWRLYMIISWNLKKIHITMKQTLMIVSLFTLVSIILVLLIEIHRPEIDYKYEMVTDTPRERVRAKYCPSGPHKLMIVIYTYESIVLILGGFLCYLTRNLPSGISDSSQVANAIAGIIACVIFGVSVTQLTKMHAHDNLFVAVILVVAAAIRALHVLHRSTTLKLLEGYDLDSHFQLVQVRDPISLLTLFSKQTGLTFTFRKNSSQTNSPTDSPKSNSLRNTQITTPSSIPDNGVMTIKNSSIPHHHNHQQQQHFSNNMNQLHARGKVVDERAQIEREIEVLRHRLELLANRALYASRLQQISEIPDEYKTQSPKNASSHSDKGGYDNRNNGSNRKLKLNFTASASLSGNVKVHDISHLNQMEASHDEGSHSHRSIPDSVLVNNSNLLSLPLNKIAQPKSYVDIENFQGYRHSYSENEVKPVSTSSADENNLVINNNNNNSNNNSNNSNNINSINNSSNNSINNNISNSLNHPINMTNNQAYLKLSGRYEPSSIFWSTPEEELNEKPSYEVDEISDV